MAVLAQKSLRKADGVAEIFVPGEPEQHIEKERHEKGVPLPADTVRNLRSVARRFGVKIPAGT